MYTVLLGLPGAGKGTHAKNLSEEFNMLHLSSGNIFKNAVRENTHLGRKVKDYIHNGELVPDEITIDVMESKIKYHKKENIIFDGFPRTINQAFKLDTFLSNLDKSIDLCIYIEVEESNLIKRLSGRRVCTRDGSIYHISFNPPEVDSICDECGEKLHQRRDDREEIVKKRIEDNRTKTEKLVEYYREKGLLEIIEGTGRGPDDVQEEVDEIVEKYF